MQSIKFIAAFVLTLILCPLAMAQGFQGSWNTSFGKIDLYEDYQGTGKQNAVYGTYADRGFIYGRSNGKTLRGIFVYADRTSGDIDKSRSQYIGTFEWNLTADFSKFNGPWSWGKVIPNGAGNSWTGNRTTDAAPNFDQTFYRRNSVRYGLEAGTQINNWMNAVSSLAGAGYFKDGTFGDFSISVVSGDPFGNPNLSAGERRAVDGFKRKNPGLPDDCFFRNGDYSDLTCDLVGPAPPTVKDAVGMELIVDDTGYPYKRRVYLDATKCLPGTVRVEKAFLVCDYSGMSGSYSQSCDPIQIEAVTAIGGEIRLVTYCSGPRHRLFPGDEREQLFHEHGKRVTYFKYPQGLEHAGASDRNYKNELSPSYNCPSKRLWNNKGHINCSK